MTGYKRVKRAGSILRRDVVIIELTIPAGAYVTTPWKTVANGNFDYSEFVYKLRASEAIVGDCEPKLVSIRDYGFAYKPGSIVKPTEDFDMDPYEACASGIHFFQTQQEAERFSYWVA